MKRLIIILVASLLIIVLYFVSQYHLTLKGAWSELDREWEGEILVPHSREDIMAILIDEKGDFYVGMAYHTDILVVYHDFKIYPTKLNINNIPKENEYYYSKVQGYGANYEMHLGIVSNPKVKALLIHPREKVTRELKIQVKNIKLFYIDSYSESISKLNFIDDKYNSITLTPVNKDNN